MSRKMWVLIVVLIMGFTTFAEEGMWLLSQLENLDLAGKGLEISAEDIYSQDKTSLSNAIVWLGGCSASFVSPDGLVLTNHHCAFGALQRNSAKDSVDYLTDGFLAESLQDEMPATGQYAYTLQSMTDVTDEILKSVKKISDIAEKDKAIERKITEMEKLAENDRDDRYCYIASMYNGKQYIKFLFNKYQDVRIVYAPPAGIGVYGGDIDNWMWPRHTGDFTYLRVYQAPDGSGATYSPENIPLKSPNYLKVARTDLKEGDATFILGFPGRTMRYRSSYSIDWNLNENYIPMVKYFQSVLDVIADMSQKDPQAKLKLANYDASLNNAMKNYQGNIDGMRKSGIVEQKRQFEKELMDFIHSKRKLKKKYGHLLDEIAEQYGLLKETHQYDEALRNFGGYFTGVLFSQAENAYEVARERAKPETERRPEFSEKRVQDNLKRIDYAYLRYYKPFDMAMMTMALKRAAALPEDQRITEVEDIVKDSDSIEKWVSDAFSKTKLEDAEFVKSLYSMTAAEIEAIDDPLIQLAVKLYPAKDRAYEKNTAWSARIKELRKNYIDAIYAWKSQNLYPDANSTIRFTCGKVNGYSPADAIWYKPFTTLTGVIEKDTGEEPFDNPEKVTELYRKKNFGRWVDPELDDVPCCFLCECDITGGNSGSAVMNARGELIGLAFDGNYEAMTSDWLYNQKLQRTIAVDIRYVLFITDKFAGAERLVKEMGF